MTPEQLALIRTTTPIVAEHAEEFGVFLCDRLLDIRPGLRTMLPDDKAGPRRRVVAEVLSLASAADDLPTFLERAHRLGRQLRSEGLRAADHPAFGLAMVDAVGEVTGDEWSHAVADAWRALYGLMSEAMLEGAAAALFSGSP